MYCTALAKPTTKNFKVVDESSGSVTNRIYLIQGAGQGHTGPRVNLHYGRVKARNTPLSPPRHLPPPRLAPLCLRARHASQGVNTVKTITD